MCIQSGKGILRNAFRLVLIGLISVAHAVAAERPVLSGSVLVEGQALDGKYGIFQVALNTSQVKLVLRQQETNGSVYSVYRYPSWVPNSSRNEIVLSKQGEGDPKTEIFIYNISNKKFIRALPKTSLNHWYPVYSPTGKYLAVLSSNGGGLHDIHVYVSKSARLAYTIKLPMINGARPEFLTGPSWSNNEQQISIIVDNATYIYTLGSNTPKKLAIAAIFFQLSPKENTGAFIDQAGMLKLLDLNTGNTSATSVKKCIAFAWSPDGQSIVLAEPVDRSPFSWFADLFRNRRLQDKQAISVYSVKSGELTRVTEITAVEPGPSLSWQ